MHWMHGWRAVRSGHLRRPPGSVPDSVPDSAWDSAEALRKKKLAETQAESQALSGTESGTEPGARSKAQRDAHQKAGIGIQEFDARPIVSMPRRFVTTGLDGPDQHNRGK